MADMIVQELKTVFLLVLLYHLPHDKSSTNHLLSHHLFTSLSTSHMNQQVALTSTPVGWYSGLKHLTVATTYGGPGLNTLAR
jgi:hypothetical protein